MYSIYSFVRHVILKDLLHDPVADFIFLGFKITADGDCSHEIKILLGRKVMTNLDSIIEKQRHYFANKSPSSHSSGHVWM